MAHLRLVTDAQSMLWGEANEGYMVSMQAAGRSRGTMRLHRHYLGMLGATTANPWQVTTADLQRVLARPHWAPETRKSARAVYRAFYAWGTRAGHIPVSPAADLEPVRIPPPIPRPAPERVVQQSLREAQHRERLMIMLAAYAGLRCAEIARVCGCELEGDVLTVHGKGGKKRRVPIVEPELLAELQRLDGYAFPNLRTGQPITPGHVTRLLSRALAETWTGHTLRHRMATRAYAGTRDLLAVGAVLGHSRPETTQRYVLLPEDAIRAAMRAAAVA